VLKRKRKKLPKNKKFFYNSKSAKYLSMLKDFSIFLEKINSKSTKKDIALVSGFNAYSQYIENVCKTQKGELVSDSNFGSDYFKYIFDGQSDTGGLESSMAAYISASIPQISNVVVSLQYASQQSYQFFITYSLNDGIVSQSKTSTFVEVEL
jgi:hypothetical protein